MADSIYDGAMSQARNLASKAQDGTLKHGGKVYTLKFDRARWVYVVDCEGEHVGNFNFKQLAQAKRYLRHWLEN